MEGCAGKELKVNYTPMMTKTLPVLTLSPLFPPCTILSAVGFFFFIFTTLSDLTEHVFIDYMSIGHPLTLNLSLINFQPAPTIHVQSNSNFLFQFL